MKYFCFYILGFFILFSQTSHAQYAGGSFNMWGTGLNMGQQACPYSQGGRQRQSAYGLEDKKYLLEDAVEDLEDDLKNLETEYDSEKIPFKPGVASYLAEVIRNTKNTKNFIDTKDKDCPERKLNEAESNQDEVDLNSSCIAANGKIPSTLCTMRITNNYLYDYTLSEKWTYKNGTDAERLEKATDYCIGWVESYTKTLNQRNKKLKELEEVEKKYEQAVEREEKAQERAEERAEKRGYALPEACATCGGSYYAPEPEISGSDKAMALGLDIFNTAAWLYTNNRNRRDSVRMGFDPQHLALGMPYPYATSNLYGAAYGGQGGLGCSPTIGGFPGAYGPGGIAGSPYGGFSPYGNQGGAYGYPQNGAYPGFTPGFGGGIYNPGVAQWGMPGPWGGAGVFPPAFGINASIGAGMGNPYGAGGYGGNPYGAGNPYGGGAYGGGAYPGPYNYGYGLNANPYGGAITGPGGYGGPPNFGPGGGNPYGAGGYNPYGAGGYGNGSYNPYGANAGFNLNAGIGLNGGYDPYNPYGAGGYGTGVYGGYNPNIAGGYNPYYGAGGYNPYQAQPRAFQDQSALYGQLAAIDYETNMFLANQNQRRSWVMTQWMTGSYNGGVVYPSPGGNNGNRGLPPPPPIGQGNTGTGTAPPPIR